MNQSLKKSILPAFLALLVLLEVLVIPFAAPAPVYEQLQDQREYHFTDGQLHLNHFISPGKVSFSPIITDIAGKALFSSLSVYNPLLLQRISQHLFAVHHFPGLCYTAKIIFPFHSFW